MRKLLLAAFLAVVAYAAFAAWRPAEIAAQTLATTFQSRAALVDAIK